MPQFFGNKRLIFLLVSIVILVMLIGFSLRSREQLTWPEQFVKDTVGFVQLLFGKPAQVVAGFLENVSDLRHTYEENQLLKARLEEYAALQAEVESLRQENERLRALLDKKESLRDFIPIQATVIGRNPDRWRETVIVNKGAQHGVKKDMAVITPAGLVGKVQHASQFTSTVQLLSALDQNNRISAYVQGNENVFGLIEGYDSKRRELILGEIPIDAKVKEKQKVLTSGLGGVFPKGLPIGEVTEVKPDQYGLTQVIYVKPFANLYDVDDVMIVKRTIDATLQEEEEAK
ncbi:rod shape-determining protein MreC [Geobacillus stearothermophilus]|jgi:rod shape-determining protein MreC|uniref:Cell shape-determining protein MreC n=1 Tax=Geobacillus stearothermophilus TaxID=1422 RepID=A0A087LD45_GEOSE|nr:MULTISPECIES: rod shape-determining protein MreC [Geobacillus]AKU25919.1 rod shape-determining protein MreC [Geobacillus sp. LC300]ASS86702.1 rod shape-determining protein MreC [Geobacillus lituanicus]MED0654528.1 rod shape-determining protein MreC [Anoxybacillus geothermalis]ATA60828.1 Cell shape determining lipoprotein precursor [Geobacillus stearothermophilus]KFL15548.1 rod shape-determining protein MreC [Geobacillus stearothermophilus]